jgi:hypothetical protein
LAQHRLQIVHDGNLTKFSQNEELKEVIFATVGTPFRESITGGRDLVFSAELERIEFTWISINTNKK